MFLPPKPGKSQLKCEPLSIALNLAPIYRNPVRYIHWMLGRISDGKFSLTKNDTGVICNEIVVGLNFKHIIYNLRI